MGEDPLTRPANSVAPIPILTIEALEADPHGMFRHYRALTPVIATERGATIVLRAVDVEPLMRDPRVFSSGTKLVEMQGVTSGALFDMFQFGMLTANGAEHRKRRSPFTRTFAAGMIAALRPEIRQGADALIDEWQDAGEVDLVDRYAALLPARVISAILGLPPADIPRFTRLVYSVSRILSFTFSPDELAAIQEDARELYDYVEALLAGRRQSASGDFLSIYLAEAATKDELSQVEIVVQIIILIAAGTDTTRVAMASQVSLLLQHREQWDALRADPRLAHQAVAEALRFEPSVASVGRLTQQDINIGEAVIPAGHFLILSTMSASRDEAVYERADSFDIHRTDQRRLHTVFGGGVHRCLGEALAWAELEEGLTVLADRLPQLNLAGAPPAIRGHMGIRRIGEMPLVW